MKFLTMLLFTHYAFSEIGRWKDMVSAAWKVQGALHNLALLVGSNLQNDEDQKIAYRFYRYLTLVHMLQFKGLTEIFQFDYDALENVSLIDSDESVKERAALTACRDKDRDGVITWIGMLLRQCIDHGHLPTDQANLLFEQLSRLRGDCVTLHDLLSFQPPISLAILMQILMEIQVATHAAGVAGSYAQSNYEVQKSLDGDVQWSCEMSWQPALSAMVTTVVFASIITLCEWLRLPFRGDFDDVNAEFLVFSSARTCFHTLKHGHINMASIHDFGGAKKKR
jgi:hypothetical protein